MHFQDINLVQQMLFFQEHDFLVPAVHLFSCTIFSSCIPVHRFSYDNKVIILIDICQNMSNIKRKIQKEIIEWCKELRKSQDDRFQTYRKKLEKLVNQKQELRDILIEILVSLVQEDKKFYLYWKDIDKNKDLKALIRMLIILKAKTILREQDIIKIKSFIISDLEERVAIFLKEVTNMKSMEEVNKLWQLTIRINQKQFWSYIKDDLVEDQKLITLYRLCKLNHYINQCNAYYVQYLRLLNKYQWKEQITKSKFSYDKEQILTQYISKHSLFMNPRLVEDATRQINKLQFSLRQVLKNYDFNFCLFGSFRNRTTLLNDTDGDVTIFSTSFSPTSIINIKSFLLAAKGSNNSTLGELHRVELFNHRISFIKLFFYEMNQNQRTFEGNNFHFKTIDLLINNEHGVKNSSVIAKYTKNSQVLKLCCLTKLWAKGKKLINGKDPRGHFSSYGINLMTIFYLIKSGQASYEKVRSNGYEIQHPKITKTLYQNLLGFFQFYSRDSQFYIKKQCVCLLQNERGNWDYELIVNMYDFIDDTNPGRMKKDKQILFFKNIQYAIRVLREQKIHRLESIFID